ncbi:MAG: FeoA family protein, partial [bacterium]
PIPTGDGKILLYRRTSLAELQPDHEAVIVEIDDHDPTVLRQLDELGLLPKERVITLNHQAETGFISVGINDCEYRIKLAMARCVFIDEIRQIRRPYKPPKILRLKLPPDRQDY